MKKAIVTGANGFVGSSVCKELANRNFEVIAIIRNKEENISNISGIKDLKIIYCDLSEFKNLTNLIKDKDIDIFYHFAWIGTAGPLRGDKDIQLKNIEYTLDTVKACADIGCKRFVFASSIMEYEISAIMEKEIAPNLNTLYSSAKLSADYMARTIANSLEIDYIRTVISNIYGPGETSPRLINTSIRKLLNNEHCAFSEGEQMYDFIYIDDAAKAFVAVGEKGKANKTYYIGSLSPRPLRDYLIVMKNGVNPKLDIGLGELGFDGITLTYNEFDINAVKEDTGFIPKVSFEEGIKRTVSWIKETL